MRDFGSLVETNRARTPVFLGVKLVSQYDFVTVTDRNGNKIQGFRWSGENKITDCRGEVLYIIDELDGDKVEISQPKHEARAAYHRRTGLTFQGYRGYP